MSHTPTHYNYSCMFDLNHLLYPSNQIMMKTQSILYLQLLL